MSFYKMTDSMYRPPAAATPGWQLAPVPGWGMNPERAGPPVLATLGLGASSCGTCGLGDVGDEYRTMTEGHVALAAAAGIVVGWFFGYVFFKTR